MNNFIYYAPTKIVFGKNTEDQVGELIKEQNAKKVLLHYGSNSAVKSGLIGRIKKSLESVNIDYVELSGVVPNPRLSLVYEGIELAKKEQIDFILAVGGGSVIDSAKAIGFGLHYDGDVWDLFEGKAPTIGCTPIGCVLTIAAAGSEMSSGSVVTKDEGMLKRSTGAPSARLKFSILNPELTYSLPDYQTACGVVDIIMHTLERYFNKDETMSLSDRIAKEVLKNVIQNARILLNDPNNYNARAEIMWSGSVSHNDITGLGAGSDWATHNLEHELSGMFDVAHGAGLSALWDTWARYVYQEKPERFEQFAREVFDLTGDDLALRGIKAMEEFFQEIKMPVSIPELINRKLSEAELVKLSEMLMIGRTNYGGFKVLGKEDGYNIYKIANEK